MVEYKINQLYSSKEYHFAVFENTAMVIKGLDAGMLTSISYSALVPITTKADEIFVQELGTIWSEKLDTRITYTKYGESLFLLGIEKKYKSLTLLNVVTENRVGWIVYNTWTQLEPLENK
jgi:hypothetical protein